MQKNMLLLAILFTACMQAMENNEANSWSITIDTTKINLIKGFIGDAGDRVDIMVIGRNQQQTLQEPAMDDSLIVASCDLRKDHIIYRKSEDDESASDDDTYKPFEFVKHFDQDEKKKIWKRAAAIKVNADVLTVIEPRITSGKVCDSRVGDVIEVPCYCAHRYHPYEQIICQESGQQAINEATQDLIRCYRDAFMEAGLLKLDREKSDMLLTTLSTERKTESIALQALSTEVGFPRAIAARIAIYCIRMFARHCPDEYGVIELFVKKRSEFDLYKKFLTMPFDEL